MILYDTFEQYSDPWWAVRRGVPTGSEFHRIITAAKGEFAAAHKGYIAALIGDELRQDYPDKDERATNAMRRGSALEPEARGLYKAWSGGESLRQVGFCTTDCGRFGCSPDALVGDEGVLELKAPTPGVHAGYVLEGVLPSDYKQQVHGHLAVTGRKWCDFMSYLPGQDPFIVRVTPNEFTAKMFKCLTEFDFLYHRARVRFGLSSPQRTLCLPDLFELAPPVLIGGG